jgi:hypothetical protein
MEGPVIECGQVVFMSLRWSFLVTAFINFARPNRTAARFSAFTDKNVTGLVYH